LIRTFGRTLAETERLSPEKLRLYQAPLISKLLRHARHNTDFYRNRFDFDLDSAEEIERNWSAIPILTRAEAVANRERLLSRFEPPEAGATEEGVTSGSTGMPLSFRQNQLNSLASQALTERMWRWWKIDGTKSCARISFDHHKSALPPHGATFLGWHSAHPRACSTYFPPRQTSKRKRTGSRRASLATSLHMAVCSRGSLENATRPEQNLNSICSSLSARWSMTKQENCVALHLGPRSLTPMGRWRQDILPRSVDNVVSITLARR
jgi:hypothetical protein